MIDSTLTSNILPGISSPFRTAVSIALCKDPTLLGLHSGIVLYRILFLFLDLKAILLYRMVRGVYLFCNALK